MRLVIFLLVGMIRSTIVMNVMVGKSSNHFQ